MFCYYFIPFLVNQKKIYLLKSYLIFALSIGDYMIIFKHKLMVERKKYSTIYQAF